MFMRTLTLLRAPEPLEFKLFMWCLLPCRDFAPYLELFPVCFSASNHKKCLERFPPYKAFRAKERSSGAALQRIRILPQKHCSSGRPLSARSFE